MTAIPNLNIILDNETCIYYPGQTISGRVEYTILNNPGRVRGIGVIIKGECETSWYESETTTVDNKETTIDVPYFGKEDYLNTSFFVIGSEHGDSVELPAGTNVFPIKCELPSNIPCSFEGQYGYVRYSIVSIAHTPWQTAQIIQSLSFTVVAPLDLNLSPKYRKPIEIALEKTLGCCCWASGDVNIELRSPVRGYCHGQVIPLDITCENNSTSSVEDIQVFLRETITFKTLNPSSSERENERDVAELSLGKVGSRMSLNWQKHLEVPIEPSPNLTNCGLIKLNHHLILKCVAGGCHTDKKETQLVAIGTVPLTGVEFPVPETPDLSQTDITVNEMCYAPILNSTQSPAPGSPYPMSDITTDTTAEMISPSAPPRNVMYSSGVGRQKPTEYSPSYVSVAQSEDRVAATPVNQSTSNVNTTDPGKPNFVLPYPAYGFQLPTK